MLSEPPVLHVCTTCRAGAPLPADGVPPGTHLFEAVSAAAAWVVVRPVTCLSSCNDGCAAAVSAPGKWTYLLGRLHPGLTADLLDYVGRYAASVTGTVMPSRRAPSLARMILGRVPGAGQVVP